VQWSTSLLFVHGSGKHSPPFEAQVSQSEHEAVQVLVALKESLVCRLESGTIRTLHLVELHISERLCVRAYRCQRRLSHVGFGPRPRWNPASATGRCGKSCVGHGAAGPKVNENLSANSGGQGSQRSLGKRELMLFYSIRGSSIRVHGSRTKLTGAWRSGPGD
jgi:hypothetical protein